MSKIKSKLYEEETEVATEEEKKEAPRKYNPKKPRNDAKQQLVYKPKQHQPEKLEQAAPETEPATEEKDPAIIEPVP